MQEKDLPIEWAINEIKQSITLYSNGLCQKYRIPSAVMLQIFQEIIYENEINVLSQLITEMRTSNIETVHIGPEIKPNEKEDVVDVDESQSNDV